MNALQSIDLKTLYLLQLFVLTTPLMLSLLPSLNTWTWTPKQAITTSLYISILLFMVKYFYINDYTMDS